MTQPVIDTVGTVVNDPPIDITKPSPTAPLTTPPARATVQQVSLSDIAAKIKAILLDEENGHGLTAEQIAKIEQLGSIQVGGDTWNLGEPLGGNTAFIILAMYRGEQNDQIADAMKGDTRVYVVPVAVVRPGEKAYRRVTINSMLQRTLVDRMTYDRFVEAVAYEDFSVAVETHVVELEDDEEEEEEDDS